MAVRHGLMKRGAACEADHGTLQCLWKRSVFDVPEVLIHLIHIRPFEDVVDSLGLLLGTRQ